jgi:hypothetical protein
MYQSTSFYITINSNEIRNLKMEMVIVKGERVCLPRMQKSQFLGFDSEFSKAFFRGVEETTTSQGVFDQSSATGLARLFAISPCAGVEFEIGE